MMMMLMMTLGVVIENGGKDHIRTGNYGCIACGWLFGILDELGDQCSAAF